MTLFETILLTRDNLEEIGVMMKQFFINNGIPVYEMTYINTTMDELLNFKHEAKNHCGTVKFEAAEVEVVKEDDKSGLVLHYQDHDKPETPGIHWFELGTEFVFYEEYFCVKSPCRDYVTNRYDYTVRIFQPRS